MTKEQILQKHFTAEFGHDGHGEFMQYILNAMEEYAQQQVKNLNIPAVMQRSERLISLLEKLLENNMCSHAGDELIEQMLKEINCA